MFHCGRSFLANPLFALALAVVLAVMAGVVVSEIKSVTTANTTAEAVALRSFNAPRSALWERVK